MGRRKRNEIEVLFQEATITLGGEPHTLAVKSIRETKEWRGQLGAALAPYVELFIDEDVTSKGGAVDVKAAIRKALPQILAGGVDDFIDLVYAYAPELSEQLDSATDAERLDAAMEVLELAFPFVLKVGQAMLRMAARAGA